MHARSRSVGARRLVLPAALTVLSSTCVAAAPPTDGTGGADGSLHLRYVTARLELAKLDLEKARRQNQVAGSPQVPASDMRRLEARQAALEQVVAAQKAQRDDGEVEGQIARAKAALEVAREDLARLERLRESQPNSVGELDLRRQRVRVDIAELRVALWQDPEHIPSPIDRMQIQLDQLSDQLIDMIDQISNRRLVTPPP